MIGKMLVSIIMPYYNAEKYIHETVDSIINQTYENWELIIVDDCSPDPNTVSVLHSLSVKDSRIKVLKTSQNGGAGVARNVGIDYAKGNYLAFCDSDDWWYPTKLDEQLTFMMKNKYLITCTWYEDANENLNSYYTMKQKSKQSYRDLLSGCNIGTPGVMINTDSLGKIHMPSLRRAEDWGLWMLYLRTTEYIYTYPKALWKYRHIPGSETSNKWKMLTSVVTMYRQVLGMSVVSSWIITLLIFLPKNIVKKIKQRFFVN